MDDARLVELANQLPPNYRLQRHTLARKGAALFTNVYIENSARLAIGKVGEDGAVEFFQQAAAGDVAAFVKAGWSIR